MDEWRRKKYCYLKTVVFTTVFTLKEQSLSVGKRSPFLFYIFRQVGFYRFLGRIRLNTSYSEVNINE